MRPWPLPWAKPLGLPWAKGPGEGGAKGAARFFFLCFLSFRKRFFWVQFLGVIFCVFCFCLFRCFFRFKRVCVRFFVWIFRFVFVFFRLKKGCCFVQFFGGMVFFCVFFGGVQFV